MVSGYKLAAYKLCKRKVNRYLQSLGLPLDTTIHFHGREEDWYMRLYDIETFGMSSDVNIRNMWLEKERQEVEELNNLFL